MTSALIERPQPRELPALEPDRSTGPDMRRLLPAHDARSVGLAAVARSLGMQVADLGPLQVRRAKADLIHCPVCPGH